MLQKDAIRPDTLDTLKLIQSQPELSGTRLVGGTALALQFGHRLSIDIDLFGIWDRELDLHEVLERCGSVIEEHRTQNIHVFNVNEILEWYRAKYPKGSEYLVLRSLVYFDDAEEDPMPIMLKPMDWESAKERIRNAVREVA